MRALILWTGMLLASCGRPAECVFCGAGDGGAIVTTTSLTTGGGGDGGTAGVGGVPMGGTGGEATGGAGGSTTTTTSTSTTTTTLTGGDGGAGGALPAACYPLSQWGTNCAEDVCGTIPEYPKTFWCDLPCAGSNEIVPEKIYELGPTDETWVFSDFSFNIGCQNFCPWAFVVRLYGQGCARATVSDGLRVAYVYGATVCGPPTAATCVYEDGEGPSGEDLRIVATVDPDNVPDAAWLRVETIPQGCAGSGFGCPL
jgi:hypothetical protein